ncbi:hypothetical protein V2J09_018301 [Rumex salicifolius]
MDFPFPYDMVVPKVISGTVRSSPTNDVLLLLRSLEIINRCSSSLGYSGRANMFAKGECNNLYSNPMIPKLSQNEFVNNKLSEKLDHQMLGFIPLWCNRRLDVGSSSWQHSEDPTLNQPSNVRSSLFSRERILESAASMMDQNTLQNAILEVEYHQEVGTGLGPTLEFFIIVCHEFQKPGLGMWREDYQSSEYMKSETDLSSRVVTSSLGLFPRPWSEKRKTSNGINISDVIKRFSLLGWIVAKALQDGRVLDIHLPKAFFKLIVGQVKS